MRNHFNDWAASLSKMKLDTIKKEHPAKYEALTKDNPSPVFYTDRTEGGFKSALIDFFYLSGNTAARFGVRRPFDIRAYYEGKEINIVVKPRKLSKIDTPKAILGMKAVVNSFPEWLNWLEENGFTIPEHFKSN